MTECIFSKFSPDVLNEEEGAALLETIALASAVLLLIGVIYTTIQRNSDRIDNAIDDGVNTQIEVWENNP